jgi:hypothetical protein
MLQGSFSLNTIDYFAGYHDPSITWNGWRVPYFDHDTAADIMQYLFARYGVGYEFTDDYLLVYEGDEITDRIKAVKYTTDDGYLILYRLEGYVWELA